MHAASRSEGGLADEAVGRECGGQGPAEAIDEEQWECWQLKCGAND